MVPKNNHLILAPPKLALMSTKIVMNNTISVLKSFITGWALGADSMWSFTKGRRQTMMNGGPNFPFHSCAEGHRSSRKGSSQQKQSLANWKQRNQTYYCHWHHNGVATISSLMIFNFKLSSSLSDHVSSDFNYWHLKMHGHPMKMTVWQYFSCHQTSYW